MTERARTTTKKPKAKKETSVSRTRKTDLSRSMNSPADRILFLQRTIGNQAVQKLIKSGALQAKLAIGKPGDIYEQEADRVAEQVLRMPEPQVQRQSEEEEEEEEIQAKPLAEEITPLVQRQVEEEGEEEKKKKEEEEILQGKGTSGHVPEVNSDLEVGIQALKGGGQPLPGAVRVFFEQRFGYDFSNVRVHTDARAADTVRALNAQAFTMGRDIVVGTGNYAPETSSGKWLLAHELTHVVQQTAPKSLLQRRAEEVKEELAISELPKFFGSDFKSTYGGGKAIKGANAEWNTIPTIKATAKQKGGKWYKTLDKFDIKAEYWVSSTTKWDHIKDFPEGTYDLGFNLKEGSKIHEEAELEAVKTLWENAEKNIKAGTAKSFKTKKEAEDNYNKVFNKEGKNFRTKQKAISDHSNPVGPNAEWNYYKNEYAKYKASLKKKAP